MAVSNGTTSLKTIVNWLDNQLKTSMIKDSSLNGLQLEGKQKVKKAAFSVDAALESFQGAVDAQADLLIVHHGLFWGQSERIVGPLYSRIKLLMEHNIALYASHLPLDAHEKWGNNIVLAKGLGLRPIVPFGDYHGQAIGFGGTMTKAVSLQRLAAKLSSVTGFPAQKLAFGKKQVKKIAIVSGGGGAIFKQAAQEGYDTYITGEFLHQDVQPAKELGINIITGGHYATETLGVKALSKALAAKFSIKTVFLDFPTGF